MARSSVSLASRSASCQRAASRHDVALLAIDVHCVGPRQRELRDARNVCASRGRCNRPRWKLELDLVHPLWSGAPRMMLSMSRVVPTRAAIATMLPAVATGTGSSVCASITARYSSATDDSAASTERPSRFQHRGRALAGVEGVAHGEDRAREHARARPICLAQIGVATRERDAVRLSHRRRDDQPNGKVEIAHHRANQRRLLDILLSEHRNVRLHDVEQLRHHGEDAGEVSGS